MRTTVALLALTVAAGAACAMPTTPVYTQTFADAVTGDNSFISGGFRFYTVDAGADSYQNDIYERPFVQAFNVIGTAYAVEEYHSYVDIEQARIGWDNQFVYFALDMVGLEKLTKDGARAIEGLKAKYMVRFGTNPDGRNSYYIMGDEPGFASFPNTVFAGAKTEGWRDADLDVGGRGGPIHGQPGPSGLSVTRTQNVREEFGMNGFEQAIILSDGTLNAGAGGTVLWQRVSPTDPTVVELALDYVALGLTRATIEATQYLDFAAVAGAPAGPENGLWNDKYTAEEAGSPNRGIGTDSEFGTQGLGAIYLADNVRGTLSGVVCDSIDFNNDGLFPDDADLVDFLSVLAGGPCSTGAACSDIDFNNDGLFPDDSDLVSFLRVLAGGPC
jgi:hypothetical protein